MPAEVARRLAPAGFLLGVSCHSLAEALAAQAAGADYILLGLIFRTPSKLQYGPPLGISTLSKVTSQVNIPVFALGGIGVDRVRVCQESGAAGIGGIRIFQDSESIAERVREPPLFHDRREEPTPLLKLVVQNKQTKGNQKQRGIVRAPALLRGS